MKKKLLLITLMVAMLVCLFVISASAEGQSYSTFEVVLTDGTAKTAYTAGLDPWEGRIYLNAKLYAEAPIDTEGTYEEINWTTVKEIDFSNSMLYYWTNNAYKEQAYGTNQSGTALCIYPNGLDRKTQLTSLEKVTTGKAVTLREGAFNGAPAIKTVVFSKALKYVHNNVFYHCTTIESLIIEDGSQLETISDSFLGCTGLKSVSFPATLKTLGDNTFNGCTSLETVTFAQGSSELKIKNYVFSGCTELKNLTLVEGIVEIGSAAFQNCDALVSVTIPDSVTTLSGAFGYCDNLESLVISDNSQIKNKLIGLLEYSPKITSIRIPPLVTEIGYDNFRGCTSLSEIIWPNNLQIISGGQNFTNIALKSISFPNTLTSIAAGNLNSMEEIRLGASLTFIGDGNFAYTTLKRVYIPAGASFGTRMLGYSNPADSSNNITFIFTGTLEQAMALQAAYKESSGGESSSYAPNNQKFYNATLVSADEYDVTQEPNGIHLVYNYNLCKAFYGNVHNITEPAYKFVSYVDECYTEGGCSRCDLKEKGEIYAPIFTFLGYSTKQGGTDVTAGYTLDADSIKAYKDAGYTLSYGVVAYVPLSGNTCTPLTQGANGVELVEPNKTIHTEIVGDYASVDFVIRGFGAEQAVELAMCMYVYDGESISYLCSEDKSLEQRTEAYTVLVDMATGDVTKA